MVASVNIDQLKRHNNDQGLLKYVYYAQNSPTNQIPSLSLTNSSPIDNNCGTSS